jgi:hypothetical protein
MNETPRHGGPAARVDSNEPLGETALRALARERIASGLLPAEPPARMWGGPGTGKLCSLCARPISREEIEYEVDAEMQQGVRNFRFHLVCQSAWQLTTQSFEDSAK